jgi:xanthine dehydrogenase accessory factor
LCLRKALESQAPYIALIASRHRAKLVLAYLAEAGFTGRDLERVWAPAGLEIGAGSPEEIALSVMSQVVAVYRGVGREKARREAEGVSGLVIRQCDTGLPLT